MTILQFNPMPMLLLAIFVFVAPPIVALIIALVAYKKRKKKVALVFLILSILYVLATYLLGSIYEQF